MTGEAVANGGLGSSSPVKAQLDSEQGSLVWIHYMLFLKRTMGLTGSREVGRGVRSCRGFGMGFRTRGMGNGMGAGGWCVVEGMIRGMGNGRWCVVRGMGYGNGAGLWGMVRAVVGEWGMGDGVW